jgi:hypothetical protein
MSALKKYTPEWIAEAEKAPRILKAALDTPDDIAACEAMFETLKKLGLVVPISPASRDSAV